MRIALFCHSLRSDYNHGNAHFLRGVACELDARGHEVRAFEPEGAWSAARLEEEHGPAALEAARAAYPRLAPVPYDPAGLDLDRALDGVDLVLVHEWSDPDLVRRVGAHRARGGRYRLLFHDTHHRLVTDPAAMARYDLSAYDGVLAFGRALRDLYHFRGLAARAWVWHEAADVRVFRPLPGIVKERDLVWIGNYGDGERARELRELLIGPVKALGLAARAHGVRYPPDALAELADAGIDHAGWLPNFLVPDAFARARVTVHIPRAPYATALPGIPTIRVFEALACGIPLVSAPWCDAEGLFTPGRDYLEARSGAEMERHLLALLTDPALAARIAEQGLRTVLARHTCAHRVDELLAIVHELDATSPRRLAPARPPPSPASSPPESPAGAPASPPEVPARAPAPPEGSLPW